MLRSERQPLDDIFKPKSVALIGASERPGSVGRNVLWNLLSTPFGGTVYPVNPKRENILGIRAYKGLRDLPERPDLIVVTTPSSTVPGLIREAVEIGVPAAIVISAGFKEAGEQGKEYERQIKEMIAGKMRLIGPNCLGVMNPITGMNATFAQTVARPGNLAFISQSGALCTAVLDWSLQEMVGFSAFVSIGSMLDVDWGDLITYFGNDPRTNSIVIYMESIGDPRSFLSAAREVSLVKPIIVIKAGRTAAAAKAAASHTGSMTGSDAVLDAAFRRTGVLRVDTIGDIFHMSEVLAKQPRPAGPRLCIVTNAGGPGVLATDALVQGGGELADVSPESMEAFNKILPDAWSHNNPVDILGDAEPERYSKSLEIAAKDPNIDGMLVIMTPQGMTDPTRIAENLKPYAQSLGKPVLASWMGGTQVTAGEEILNRAGIPTFPFPDAAAEAFNYMWKYSYNLKGLYETPIGRVTDANIDRQKASDIIQHVRKTGRTILTEFESKELLKAYGIPVTETRIATSADAAVKAADEIGYPVVLKLHSETITHKTDVGGVQLNLRNAEAVRTAYNGIEASVLEKAGKGHFLGVTVQPMAKLDGYEVILGSSLDAQFGPVLLFGSGGQLVEVYKDSALGLPPLNSTLARRMMEQTKIYKALKGVRGRKPVDLAALEDLLVRFSQLIVEQPWIKELDINPLLASPERLLALDARVVVHGPEMTEDKLPKPAIRPYPIQYIGNWKMKDGNEVSIRPIRPEDEPALVEFHKNLSERTVTMRYFQPLHLSQRTAHERLTRICFIDYDREMALVAENSKGEIIAVGRMSKEHGTASAEMAAIIRDEYHHKGLGTELFRRQLDIARAEGINEVFCNMMSDNGDMQAICKKLGFTVNKVSDTLVHASLKL
ncbi:MAG TPA: bifunctional acetate--CoA ligase family protein/GNAT family N-acetyltransferase [Terriglobales bacterium]|nr:bifunctional acetate--CoA ligase family protein/GNAT family N-acetyltransferase [Terriglobales bacterium]